MGKDPGPEQYPRMGSVYLLPALMNRISPACPEPALPRRLTASAVRNGFDEALDARAVLLVLLSVEPRYGLRASKKFIAVRPERGLYFALGFSQRSFVMLAEPGRSGGGRPPLIEGLPQDYWPTLRHSGERRASARMDIIWSISSFVLTSGGQTMYRGAPPLSRM